MTNQAVRVESRPPVPWHFGQPFRKLKGNPPPLPLPRLFLVAHITFSITSFTPSSPSTSISTAFGVLLVSWFAFSYLTQHCWSFPPSTFTLHLNQSQPTDSKTPLATVRDFHNGRRQRHAKDSGHAAVGYPRHSPEPQPGRWRAASSHSGEVSHSTSPRFTFPCDQTVTDISQTPQCHRCQRRVQQRRRPG